MNKLSISKNLKFIFNILLILCMLTVYTKSIKSTMADQNPKNVNGNPLRPCKEGTGFYRNGYCNTGADDHGTHVVCAVVSDEFLTFTKSQGNDLSTPTEYFPGLKPGDHWCLCGYRFEQARKAGLAPKIILESTHIKALEFTPLEELKKHALF